MGRDALLFFTVCFILEEVASPQRFRQRDAERVIDQRLDRREELHGVRQRCVQFERGAIAPMRMNIELARLADGLERLVADAARFEAGRTFDCLDGFAQRLLAAGASVKAGEEEEFHGWKRTDLADRTHAAMDTLSKKRSEISEST